MSENPSINEAEEAAVLEKIIKELQARVGPQGAAVVMISKQVDKERTEFILYRSQGPGTRVIGLLEAALEQHKREIFDQMRDYLGYRP